MNLLEAIGKARSVYVGGSSSLQGRARVQEIQAMLRNQGVAISWDWTVFEGDPAEVAQRDLYAISVADALVMTFEPDAVYRGTHTEVGIALTLRKPIYILGHAGDENVFLAHPLVKRIEI